MHPTKPDASLDQFRAAVMADPAAQQVLAEQDISAEFAARACAFAAERGIALDPGIFLRQDAPDPLGIHRYAPAPQGGYDWPGAAWLPVQLAPDDLFKVDWLHFAGLKPDHAFFDDSIRRVVSRPFNRFFRYRTPLESFVDPARAALPLPRGLIFHMSRCGSTLVSQMLGAAPGNAVLSEAAPFDSLLQLPVKPQHHSSALRSMAAALGRGHANYFLKTDAWHILQMPLLREAFPKVPWIFLYRDPVEVLVSHARMPSRYVVPDAVSQMHGLADTGGIDHVARGLALLCEAAVRHHADGGLLVHYRELPDALFTRILPHFGIEPTPEDRALMAQAAQRDAKTPAKSFSPDSAEKRKEATDAVREAARHLAPAYAKLEAIRAASPPAAV
ncbi:MAG: sulfotransferase [Pseudomonadota bacterium]